MFEIHVKNARGGNFLAATVKEDSATLQVVHSLARVYRDWSTIVVRNESGIDWEYDIVAINNSKD